VRTLVFFLTSKLALLKSDPARIAFASEYRASSLEEPNPQAPLPKEFSEPFVPEVVYESHKGNKRFDTMRVSILFLLCL
jgi:hypothetical protein